MVNPRLNQMTIQDFFHVSFFDGQVTFFNSSRAPFRYVIRGFLFLSVGFFVFISLFFAILKRPRGPSRDNYTTYVLFVNNTTHDCHQYLEITVLMIKGQ